MWAILALMTALLTSFNPILYKRMLGESGPVAVVWGVNGLALPLLAATTFAPTPTWPQVDGWFLMGIFGSATLNVLAHLASARSLKLADASLVSPLLAFNPVFTVLISFLFLGEAPEARGVIGVALVLTGAYWLNRGPGSDWLTPVILRSGRWALTPLSRRKRDWLLATLIAGTAPALGYTAISLGLVGYVTTLFRLSAVFTVIWGAWLLGESGLRQRLPASMTMVVGAVLIVS